MNPIFNELLLRFSQEPNEEERNQVEHELWDKFGTTITTVIVDMSGFTRLTRAHGVVHYLSMIRRLQLIAQPIFENYDGTIVKFEADNCFAHFPMPGNAITSCIALNLAMDSANILTVDELDIQISCGIDHGKCLLPSLSDYFGDPVNRASKLGEDIGEPGQILVTADAMALVSNSLNVKTELIDVQLGGDDESVHSVVYRH